MAADLYLYAVPDTAENRDLIVRIVEYRNAGGEFGYDLTDEYNLMMEKLLWNSYPDQVHISSLTTMNGLDPYWFPLPSRTSCACSVMRCRRVWLTARCRQR